MILLSLDLALTILCLFIYLFIYFDIYTYVACLKFVMLFLVKLNEAKDFRLELLFIWHHKSNTLIDLRTFINTFIHNNVVLRKQLSYFSWFRFLSLFLEGSPGFFNQKIKYLQISIFFRLTGLSQKYSKYCIWIQIPKENNHEAKTSIFTWFFNKFCFFSVSSYDFMKTFSEAAVRRCSSR